MENAQCDVIVKESETKRFKSGKKVLFIERARDLLLAKWAAQLSRADVILV